MRDSGPFYLTTISKPKGQVWFSRQRMGEHKIGQLMKDMAVKSGLFFIIILYSGFAISGDSPFLTNRK